MKDVTIKRTPEVEQLLVHSAISVSILGQKLREVRPKELYEQFDSVPLQVYQEVVEMVADEYDKQFGIQSIARDKKLKKEIEKELDRMREGIKD